MCVDIGMEEKTIFHERVRNGYEFFLPNEYGKKERVRVKLQSKSTVTGTG